MTMIGFRWWLVKCWIRALPERVAWWLGQQLEDERKACGHWFKEANQGHNRVYKLEAQLEEARKERDDLQRKLTEAFYSEVGTANKAHRAEAAHTALCDALRRLFEQMREFATTKPSGQQTRQKTAREMVDCFAHELYRVLASHGGKDGKVHGDEQRETWYGRDARPMSSSGDVPSAAPLKE